MEEKNIDSIEPGKSEKVITDEVDTPKDLTDPIESNENENTQQENETKVVEEEEIKEEIPQNEAEEDLSKKPYTKRWDELEALLKTGSMCIWEVMGISEEIYRKIRDNNEKFHLNKAHRFGAILKHCTYLDVIHVKRSLPRGTEVEMKTSKLQILNKVLERNGLTFSAALSYSEKKAKQLLIGQKVPSIKECQRIANYFLMPSRYLLDDSIELPNIDKIKIDETIASIQRADFENEVKLQKNKHFIQRNWQILSHPKRIKLILHLTFTIIPLVAYTGACAYTIIKDRFETQEKYQVNENNQTVSEKESYRETNSSGENIAYEVGESYEDAIYKSPKVSANAEGGFIANVDVGTQIVKIGNISPSTSSYGVAMRLWMDFDQTEYHEMVQKKANPEYAGYKKAVEQYIANSYITYAGKFVIDPLDSSVDSIEETIKYDVLSFNKDTNKFEFTGERTYSSTENDSKLTSWKDRYLGGDGIPDWMQIKDFNFEMINSVRNGHASYQSLEDNLIYEDKYSTDRAQYPLETSSDNYPDKETMFIVGNGEIDAHSFSYEVGTPYQRYNATTGKLEHRYFSCCYFDATIRKAFDNVRYPLDSVQFHIYIMPMQMLVGNVRYNPIDVVSLNTVGDMECSLDGQTFYTGVSPVFMMANGYKLIKNYKNFVTRIYYYSDEKAEARPDWSQFKTEYEIVVRANRKGLNLFLQAFMNLFCVAIWITIAFYSQSHQGENQLGMMGTGLFAGISSILVGLSMVSDAGIISMITMINVFTLAVIIIMTWQCIGARTAQVKADLVGQAFNGIKMRIMFYILLACTLIMFIGLPICGFLWYL